MATTRDLLNNVLVGLRKDEIADGVTVVTSAYHKLLLQFINTAKEEVEEAWDWEALRKTITITGVASQSTYTLDTAGDGDIDLGPRAKLLYEKESPSGNGIWVESSRQGFGSLPQFWDTTDVTPKWRMRERSYEKIQRKLISDDDTTRDHPTEFAIHRTITDITAEIYRTPTGARQWQARFIDYPAELAASDITTVIEIPDRAIWTLALAKANMERGEQLGRPGTDMFDDSDIALANAIALEQTDEDITGYPV